MRDTSKYIKLLFVFLIILIILLLIIIFSLFRLLTNNKKTEEKEKKKIVNEYKLDNINLLYFEFKRANIVIKNTSDKDLKIIQNTKEEKFYLNNFNSSNSISFYEDSIIFDGKQRNYVIYIPDNFDGNLNIVNGFGNLKIENIKINLSIDNNTGIVDVNNCGNLNIKNVSGLIKANDLNGNFIATTSTGNITADKIYGSINIESLTGDISIKNLKLENDSYIENISGDIELSINKKSNCKLTYSNEKGINNVDKKICKKGKNKIEVKNIMGNIDIK